MKHLRFLPLAFLAGAHGFALLAPYLAICMTAYSFHLQRKRRVSRIQQRVPEASTADHEALVIV